MGVFLFCIFGVLTAFIGLEIHHNIFWAVIDYCFWPVVWVKWLLFHEVTLSIIKESFAWFFK